MIAKLTHPTVVVTRRMADAARRATRTIAAELTVAWKRHRAQAVNNATDGAVLAAAAAWISGAQPWQDAIVAIVAAALGVTAQGNPTRRWRQLLGAGRRLRLRLSNPSARPAKLPALGPKAANRYPAPERRPPGHTASGSSAGTTMTTVLGGRAAHPSRRPLRPGR